MPLTAALQYAAPPEALYSLEDALAMLEPGDTFRLPGTTRVFDQGKGDSCTAHAVVAAMETRLVAHDHLDPAATPLDPVALFDRAKHKRDLHLVLAVAARGLTMPGRVAYANSEYLGEVPIASMIGELRNHVPLVIELRVGSNFDSYDGSDVYIAVPPWSLHAMCVVGYGTHAVTREPYWIAKNSYGPHWGAGGHALLRWGDADVCPESNVHALRSVD